MKFIKYYLLSLTISMTLVIITVSLFPNLDSQVAQFTLAAVSVLLGNELAMKFFKGGN